MLEHRVHRAGAKEILVSRERLLLILEAFRKHRAEERAEAVAVVLGFVWRHRGDMPAHGFERPDKARFARRLPADQKFLEERGEVAASGVEVVAREKNRDALRTAGCGVSDVICRIDDQHLVHFRFQRPDTVHRDGKGALSHHQKFHKTVVRILLDGVTERHRVRFKGEHPDHAVPDERRSEPVRADSFFDPAGARVHVVEGLREEREEVSEVVVDRNPRVAFPRFRNKPIHAGSRNGQKKTPPV